MSDAFDYNLKLAQLSRRREHDTNLSEEERRLIHQLRQVHAGRQYALDDLVRALQPHVVRFARTIALQHGASRAIAEDAAAQALVDIYYRVHTVQEPERLLSWVRSVTYRRARRTATTEARRSPFHLLDAHQPPLSTSADNEAGLMRGYTMDAIVASVRELPERQRSVVLLRLLVGLTEGEVSKLLDIRVGTVKSHLAAGRVRLSHLLRERGVAPSTRSSSRFTTYD